MEKYLNKVLIVDGSYALHRALHTPSLESLVTTTGIKSGGVYGFLRILQSEIKKFPGYFPIICWDKGLSPRRTELYPDYKANRKRKEADQLIAAGVQGEVDDYLEEYHRQRADLIKILKYLGVPSLLIPGWEGDDLQYLISTVVEDGVVLSDDKDMIQLVSPTVKIRRAMRDETISWDGSDPYYRHPHYTIVKSICGDGSDNIPGVAKGLGWKSADKIASMIDTCESFDEYKKVLEDFVETGSGALVNKVKSLLENWSQFVINYNLTDLRLVDPPEGFEMMLKDIILGVIGKTNMLNVYVLLGKYEMKTIYPDQMVYLISASSSQVLKKRGS